MKRTNLPQRPDYTNRLLDDGFVYYRDQLPNGQSQEYWTEGSCYEFSESEYRKLHKASAELHRMYKQVLDFVIKNNRWEDLGITNPQVVQAILCSLKQGDLDLCGRFDFAFNGGTGSPKLLEYNCDSAGMMIETKAAQSWYEDMKARGVLSSSEHHWNQLERLLLSRWQRAAGRLQNKRVHFMWASEHQSPEDFMNTAYMQSLAMEAGIDNNHAPLEQMDWDAQQGLIGEDGSPIRAAWKGYHWEWLAYEAPELLQTVAQDNNPFHVNWIEPIWKMALSSKGMLAILWELFPDSPWLLPAYLNQNGLSQYVRKPLFGAESQQIEIVSEAGNYQDPEPQELPWGYVYQQYYDIQAHDGQRPVVSVWMVGGQPAGLAIRESSSLVTDFYCHTLPHIILGEN